MRVLNPVVFVSLFAFSLPLFASKAGRDLKKAVEPVMTKKLIDAIKTSCGCGVSVKIQWDSYEKSDLSKESTGTIANKYFEQEFNSIGEKIQNFCKGDKESSKVFCSKVSGFSFSLNDKKNEATVTYKNKMFQIVNTPSVTSGGYKVMEEVEKW